MTLNRFLRGTSIASVFAVFVVPFIVANGLFFPFITGKGFFFRIVVEVGFAAWLLLTFRDASARPKKSLIMWSFVGFAAIIAVADIFGANPWKSFWSNFERMEGYITLIHLFLYFIVAGSVMATENLWKRFLEASLWSSVLISLYGALQLLGKLTINQGGVRVDATFGNATYLAIFLVFNIFFALILIVQDKAVWKRAAYSLIALFHLVILYHTATRGSMLGLIGGLLLSGLLIAIFDKKERTLRIVAGSVVGFVVLVVLGFVAARNADFVTHSPVLSRFASISWNETKTQARAYIWPMAIKGFTEHPILGWGQENFNYIFNANYDPRMYSQEQWFDHTHNTVLDWLVAGGLLGLIAYLSLFASALYLLWKKAHDISFTEKALLTGLFAAYFFHNLFVFDNIMSYILFAAALSFIHFKSTRLSKPIGAEGEDMDRSEVNIAGAAVLVALIFSIYFFTYRGYETGKYLIAALQASSSPSAAPAAVEAFRQALSYDTLGRPEVVERLVEATQRINTQETPMELRQKFYDMGKKAVDEQTARFKGDARYELFAANFYTFFGDSENAGIHFANAVSLSPRKQTIIFQLGSFYISLKRYDSALETLKRAYDLEPSYSDAIRYYAVALVYVGREKDARDIYMKSFGTASLIEDLFIRAYADLGRWDKVIAGLSERIKSDPNNISDRQNIVAAYVQIGDKRSAIEQIREIERINPLFKPQADQFIEQLQAGK